MLEVVDQLPLVILPGTGHVGPLLQAAPAVVDLLTAFWSDPAGTVAHRRSPTRM